MTKTKHIAARLLLAKQRPLTSLIEKELIAGTADFEYDKSDWVPLYFDRGNAVTSDCGTITAFRAATLQGQLLWMVHTPGKSCGYHADCDDPFDAIEQAKTSWASRKAVRQDWDLVEQTAKDLLWGKQRFDVRIEDAHASPLCTAGVEGFRSAIGLGRFTKMPGWMAAVLFKVEPQMGFVIHAAMQRHAAEQSKASQMDVVPSTI